jgi:small subunit ribosomal protein S16
VGFRDGLIGAFSSPLWLTNSLRFRLPGTLATMVKIRLRRIGKKGQPSYRVVVTDARSPRDGRFIENIGSYDPMREPSFVEIDGPRALEWIGKGAQPSQAVTRLMEIAGVVPRQESAAASKPAVRAQAGGSS